jgi:hypothetical protein
MEDKKKPYVQPTITDHGKVTKETQGIVSTAYESFGHRSRLDEGKL